MPEHVGQRKNDFFFFHLEFDNQSREFDLKKKV